MRDFLSKSKVRDIVYMPHFLALNGHIQAFLYCWIELLQVKLRQPLKYEREMFKLSDGGTIALDWHIDNETGAGKPIMGGRKQPILALVSGLSGGNDNLYLYSMIRAASLSGFKCVVVNFRGASGVQLTSGLIYWLNLWEDLKEPIDYIHAKYCTVEGKKMRRIYAYGVSLGASLLTSYLQ